MVRIGHNTSFRGPKPGAQLDPPHPTMPDGRGFRRTGMTSVDYPSDGGAIDGVLGITRTTPTSALTYWLLPASTGGLVQVELAASAASGQTLRVLSDGRFTPSGSGVRQLRTLEAGSAGSLVWCVFITPGV